MEIMTMADFSLNHRKNFLDYIYPTTEKVCEANLAAAHWLRGAIIMTYWDTLDNEKIKCALFRDTHCNYICSPDTLINIKKATLHLVKASSGKVYLRKIEF